MAFVVADDAGRTGSALRSICCDLDCCCSEAAAEGAAAETELDDDDGRGAGVTDG